MFIHQTLSGLHTAGAWSNKLPQGNYLALSLLITGTKGSASAETDLPDIKVQYSSPGWSGDIVNADGANLRKYCRFMGGVLKSDTTAGASIWLVVVPFSHFGYPNSLYVGKEQTVTLWVGTPKTTWTACSCEVGLVKTKTVPMNYLPIISQKRYATLGGINSEPINVENMMGIMLGAASTTEPTTVTVKTRKGEEHMFAVAHQQYFSDWQWDADSANSASLINILTGDLSDALDDEATVYFSGGSGYLDYLVVAANMRPELRAVSRAKVQAFISQGWAAAGVRTQQGGAVPAPNFKPEVAAASVALD